MQEFFRLNYLHLTLATEILAAVTGLILYKKYKSSAAKFFIWFLVYIVFVDFIGTYPNYYDKIEFIKPLRNTLIRYNYWWYSIFFILGSMCFFLFYYFKIFKKNLSKSISIIVGSLTILTSIIYIIINVNQFFISFLPIVSVLASFSILAFTTLYFVEVLQSERILKFYKSINFYVSAAIFFWWLITTPVVFYGVYNSDEDWNFVFLKWQIFLFANIFMYTTFTIGLIVSEPELDN